MTHQPDAGYAFRLVISDKDSCHVTSLRERPATSQACPLPYLYLRERVSALGTVFAGHKRLVRLLGWLICLFPLLLIPKLVLLFVPNKVGTILVGDLITVAWVGLLVLFFAMVALLVLLYAFVGPRSRRGKGWAVTPPGDIPLERALAVLEIKRPDPRSASPRQQPARPNASALQELVDSLLKGGPALDTLLLLHGQVRRFGAPAAEVLTDSWYEYPSGILRELRGLPFILADEGQPPIVVAPGGAVMILAPYAHAGPPPQTTPPWSEQPQCTHHLALAEGQRLELVGGELQAAASLDELVLDGVAYRDDAQSDVGPYRGGALRPALVLTGSTESPLIIRVC